MSEKIAIGILCIFYAVGFAGIGMAMAPEIVFLTPFNLLLSLAVAVYFEKNEKRDLLQFGLSVFILGYGIEILGVQTGQIFGAYQYGEVLGPKFWGTPPMIGVNWVLLCYGAGYTINSLASNWHNVIKAAFAATLLVVLDFIIEPIAIKWDMWSWSEVDIPLQNYVSWWFIAFVMMNIFYYSFKNSTNNVAVAVLIIQFLFFGLLNL